MVDQGQLAGGAGSEFESSLGGGQRSAAWRALQAEGILWDGPVLVTGGGSAIPLRLILTSRRLAFTKGGAFVLEVDRAWLNPLPHLLPDGALGLTIAPETGERPERLRLVVRDGRRSAVDLVAAFNRTLPEPTPFERRPRPMPIYVPEPLAELPEPPMARGRRSSPPMPPLESDSAFPSQRRDLTEQLPPLADEPGEPAAAGPAILEPDPRPRKADRALQPIAKMTPRSSRRGRRTWVIRLSGLLLLLTLATAFGTGRLPSVPGDDFASRIARTTIDAPFAGEEPTATTAAELAREAPPTPAPPAPTLAASTAGAGDEPSLIPTVPPSRTAIALGVGGQVTPAETPEPQPAQTPIPEPAPTAPPALTTTPAPEPVRAAEIDEGAVPQPVLTATPEPEPTATPEPEPTATPEPEPTATATIEPAATTEPEPGPAPETESPAPEPTATPEPPAVTPTGTATATVTASPTPPPTPTATPAERPSFPGQRATVGEGELPAQVFAADGFRYTVETVARGATLEAAGLGPATLADWVVVVLHARNWSDTNAQLAVSSFRLITYGPYGIHGRDPDVVTGAVATTLGFDPALGAGEATVVGAGAGIRIALAYVIDPATTDLELQAGGTVIDLDAAIGQPVALNNLGNAPEPPELIEGAVEKVVDSTTIMVQAGGARTRVRLIGVAGPQEGACYARESLDALAALMAGQTVYLERQRANRIDGILTRDVWIVAEDGTRRLLAAELARAGAVVPAPSDPDIRYEGLIAAAAGEARLTGAGLWGACGGLQPPPAPADQAATETTVTDPAAAPPVAAEPPADTEQTIEPVTMIQSWRWRT